MGRHIKMRTCRLRRTSTKRFHVAARLVACGTWCLMTLGLFGSAMAADATPARHLILVTLDGLRWQELFTGADQRLMSKEAGKVADETALSEQYWRESPESRRERVMPFFWSVVARQGQVWGDPSVNCQVTVTNGHYFSYPGYSELLCGLADPAINSNDKTPNPNRSVLEFLQQQGLTVAVYTSWDVFPFILNQQRSGLRVNAGWQRLGKDRDDDALAQLDQLAAELPHVWPAVRYDVFTWHGAMSELKSTQPPRVLYVSLGETDDWAHEGRYDLYLDAAQRNDRYLAALWQAAQAHPQMAGTTSLMITTDHGRGDGRDGWKSHGVDYPGSDRIWIGVMGPDTPPLGLRTNIAGTQSQVAATVAALLGHDFTRVDPRIAAVLPGAVQSNVEPVAARPE